ncbi:MAG: hypothetical protein MJ094_01415 [Saccharofermentans sp.]|nr:hypothetical protein [Saccharofermentans sp.]
MGAVHFIVALFRPIVWALVAMLVVSFGMRFLKRLLSGISIFLLILSIGGAWLMNNMLTEALDQRYLTSDEISQLIVGNVTVIAFMVCSVGYMLAAMSVGKDGKPSKHAKVFGNITGWMFILLIPFAVMGYSLPFFFLDSVAGIVVGIIGEVGGLILGVTVVRREIKREKKKKLEEQQTVE